MKADLVICFNIKHQKEVEMWLNSHHSSNLIQLFEEKDKVLLVFNEGEFTRLSDWLDTTLSLIDYDAHKIFFDKSDGNILHLNLPFDENNQQADLSFNAKHAIILRQLSVLIDVDYYAYFDVYG